MGEKQREGRERRGRTKGRERRGRTKGREEGWKGSEMEKSVFRKGKREGKDVKDKEKEEELANVQRKCK